MWDVSTPLLSPPSIPPALPYCPLHLISHLPTCYSLCSWYSSPSYLTFYSPVNPAGPFTQTRHQPSHLLLPPNQASSPLGPMPAVCPPALDHSSSSGPTSRESRLLCSPGWTSSLLGRLDTRKGHRNIPSLCSQLLQWPLGLSQMPVWTVEIQNVGSNPARAPRQQG